ncbi:MAG: hypothetical protein HFH84_00305 [Lachnospiraceae bacterium]|nr:hypothetical protein [Lachnospiraceae bacterium]
MENLGGKDLIIRDLKRKICTMEAENRKLQMQLEEVKGERDYVRYCLDETRKSFSYRLGYTLTAVPRKLKGMKSSIGK